MQAKTVSSNNDALVFVCTYTVLVCFLSVVVLWCRPLWWNNVGIHYYERPSCKCKQCEIIHMGEVDFGGVNLEWRFH